MIVFCLLVVWVFTLADACDCLSCVVCCWFRVVLVVIVLLAIPVVLVCCIAL